MAVWITFGYVFNTANIFSELSYRGVRSSFTVVRPFQMEKNKRMKLLEYSAADYHNTRNQTYNMYL